MNNKVNYNLIQGLQDIKDRIDIFCQNHQQPLAYGAPAESIKETAERMMKLVKENN